MLGLANSCNLVTTGLRTAVSGLLVVPALGLTISGTGRRLMEGLLLLLVENDPLPEPRKNYSFKFKKKIMIKSLESRKALLEKSFLFIFLFYLHK